MERIWVIINPASGKGWGQKLQGGEPEHRFWDMVAQGSSGSAEWLANLKIMFAQPTGPHTIANLVQKALEGEATRIVVGGGDGTVNQAIKVPGVVRGVPLAIVPLGSANDLADSLGVPKDPWQAIALALSERVAVRKIDLGRINDRWFVNVASLGLDAKIIEKGTDLRTKSPRWCFVRNVSWGKVYCWLAGVGLVLGLHPKQCPEVDLRLDDWPLKIRIALINIGNGPRCGGVFRLNPNAEMDDGMLDMCLIESMGALRAVQYALRAMSGNHINLPGVISCRIERLTVECSQELSAEVDGEPLEPGHYFSIAVWREALSVIVPPSSMTLATVPVSDQKVRPVLSQSLSPEPA